MNTMAKAMNLVNEKMILYEPFMQISILVGMNSGRWWIKTVVIKTVSQAA
jgi:hypothetical protein